MTTFHALRRAAPPALVLAAALLGGCRSSCTSCSPPSDMAMRAPVGACAPCAPCTPPAAARTSPCAPPSMVPAAPPPPAPLAEADDAARRDALERTISLQRQQIELQRKRMETLADGQKVHADALDSTKASRLDAEQAAQKLADELKAVHGATVLVEGTKVSVIVTDCFDSGSDRLKPNPDVRSALRAAAAAIVRHPEAKVAVVGHTDSKPIQRSAEKWSDNVALSKARAETVAKAMSSDGVASERLAVDGRGSAEMLIVPEKTAADRARNRRVEVQFTF